MSRIASLIIVSLLATMSQAQGPSFQLVPELSQFNTGPPKLELGVTAQIRMTPASDIGVLEISATINKPWHVYSLTQPPGGPQRTEIKLEPSDEYELIGSFYPDRQPHRVKLPEFGGIIGEDFSDRVTWTVPIKVKPSVVPNQLSIRGWIAGQVCADNAGCLLINPDESRFEAKLASTIPNPESPAFAGKEVPASHAVIRGWMADPQVKAGGETQLHITVSTSDPHWHVYAYAPEKPASSFLNPTLIHLALPDGWSSGEVTTSSPVTSTTILPNEPPSIYHNGGVTWTIPIKVPASTKLGTHHFTGAMGLQTCTDSTCDMPTGIGWSASLEVVSSDARTAKTIFTGLQFSDEKVTYGSVTKELANRPSGAGAGLAAVDNGENATPTTGPTSGGFDPSKVKIEQPQSGLLANLFFAFVGGFILNFMPCVLPVIGLKIMSFVDQAGESRVRIFSLNLWYALGMLSIFLVLATLAAAPLLGLSKNALGWGQQFNFDGFNIPLICIVFTMGLSFLGVWEIPIPGFATGAKASELASREGSSGAFFKGIVTTLLATPCGAPGLVAAYGFAVNDGRVFVPYLIFTMMGLGMALPYLLIGAFPSLIRFLPKPGMWMETFKQLMGFVLLGTVIFLLYNVKLENLLPTISLLFGLWFACWWIGRVPLTAEASERLRGWGVAAIIALIAVMVSFMEGFDAFGLRFSGIRGTQQHKLIRHVDNEIGARGGLLTRSKPNAEESANALPWESYSDELLQELTKSQQTVLVDFTANW